MIFTFDVQSYKALYVKWTLFILTTVEAERIMRPWHQLSNLQLYNGKIVETGAKVLPHMNSNLIFDYVRIGLTNTHTFVKNNCHQTS
jgi:hypothetical protein